MQLRETDHLLWHIQRTLCLLMFLRVGNYHRTDLQSVWRARVVYRQEGSLESSGLMD